MKSTITITQLKQLLILNATLLEEATRAENVRRILELLSHRYLIQEELTKSYCTAFEAYVIKKESERDPLSRYGNA